MQPRRNLLTLGLLAGGMFCGSAFAAPAQVPIFLTSGTESLVMLNLSNDHELYFKAYDDYSDIDGDGQADTTYKHAVNYYGYFDSNTCYSYSSGVFEPQAAAVNKYCDTVSGEWSGNFLNWASMTRMDAIRKTLYGGYRSTDTASQTVLERSFLPTDAHSFVKYYNGADLSQLTPYTSSDISICNTTQAGSGNSKDVTEPPLMRIAQGNYSMWTAHPGVQCQWSDQWPSLPPSSAGDGQSNGNDPSITGIQASDLPPSSAAAGSAELIVRVEVCDAAAPEPGCRRYPDGNFKPIGLLQEHGEDGAVKFGLMTGSYDKNKSGGVLRKNVSDFSDEVNMQSDGTFTGIAGIVDTLNRFRLTNYNFTNRWYNDYDSCAFGKFGFNDGECSNWGNPQSEIYLETLRYFGGLSATSAFAANDADYINGLGVADWADPLDNTNYCAPIEIIHFNASTSSFDGDQLGGFGDLPGSPSPDGYTDTVGDGEGVTDASEFFVGEVSGSSDKACTPKDLDALSDAEGVCPEAPWLEGTYQIAGLAYYANQNSIRDDLTGGDGSTADVRVRTYGVALSPAQPVIRVPVPGQSGKEVIILPACMEFRDGGARHNGNCAIVDFRIVQPHTVTNGVGYGKFLVLWESGQFGGDYDQDMGGIIEYTIDGASDNITVTTDVYGASTQAIHGFGYVISGTTQDGLHIHSGVNNFRYYPDPYGLEDCSAGCNLNDGATWETYTLGTTAATALETPLFYAAKWGGFKEEADPAKRPPGADAPNDLPDQAYEWDANADGLPDNYFFARNPGQLSGQLESVFDAVTEVSSAAAVVANSASLQTTTRIYQARFDSADWSGRLLSFPVDLATGALEPPEWDAADVIAGQDFSSDREWLSWNDTTGGGVAFRWDALSDAQRAALDTNPGTGNTDNLGSDRLDFLRGDNSNELANNGSFRNRSTPLGDVVNSTPTVVGAPNFGYRDFIPGTTTPFESVRYSDFRREYSESYCELNGSPVTSWSAGSNGSIGGREPMVYFGGNDGALHGLSACTGEERIAYVPNAVFPQLSRLTAPGYAHRFYVDGPATVVDAFWGGSWHTALVGTLGAGGKAVFALDVTDPNDFAESSADSIVLWEKDDGDTGYADLGYTYSQPAVIKAEGHGWVAVFGNGYDSASGKAVLYIARIDDGTLLETIDLRSVNGAAHDVDIDNPQPNGLSTVSPIDTDGDGDVDLIYGGDKNGNVWRFAAAPGVGFTTGSTTLLYSAKSVNGVAQPITSRLAVGLHPLSGLGRMIFFGTGKYYETTDQDPANAVQYNTMYGIWDRDDGATISSVTTRNSNVLQQQTITTQTVSTFGSNTLDIRVVSNTPVAWETDLGAACGSNVGVTCGWYLDLTDTGEKMVANPILRGGRLIFVTTIPSLVPCEAGGSGWLMEIDPASGGRLDIPVFDLNGDGLFDYNDNLATGSGASTVYTPISGKKSKVGILQPPAILSGIGGSGDGSYGGREAKYSSGSSEAQIDVTIENPGVLGAGRKSWVRIK